MACPFLGTFNRQFQPNPQPDPNNVCFAGANPNWPYAAVDIEAQDWYCCSRSYQKCPRWEMTQEKGIEPPVLARAPEPRPFWMVLFGKRRAAV